MWTYPNISLLSYYRREVFAPPVILAILKNMFLNCHLTNLENGNQRGWQKQVRRMFKIGNENAEPTFFPTTCSPYLDFNTLFLPLTFVLFLFLCLSGFWLHLFLFLKLWLMFWNCLAQAHSFPYFRLGWVTNASDDIQNT